MTTSVFRAAADMAVLADAVYGTVEDMQQACEQLGYWKPIILESGNARAMVAYDYGEAVIAIAGSNDEHDWLDNSKVKRQFIHPIHDHHEIYAHAGFLRHAKLIRDELAQMGIYALIKKHDLYLTGHSLGGAVAILLPLITDWLHPTGIYTFGAPRTLSHETAGKYPYSVQRFQGATDIVPMMPLSRRFSHVGAVRYLNKGFFTEHRWGALGKWLRLSTFYARRLLSMRVSKTVVEQHSMSRYRRALEGLVNDC